MNKYESMTKEELVEEIEKLEQRIERQNFMEANYEIVGLTMEVAVMESAHNGDNNKALEYAKKEILEEVIKAIDEKGLIKLQVVEDVYEDGVKNVFSLIRILVPKY